MTHTCIFNHGPIQMLVQCIKNKLTLRIDNVFTCCLLSFALFSSDAIKVLASAFSGSRVSASLTS